MTIAMEARDLELRRLTYALVAGSDGRVPRAAQVADAWDGDVEAVRSGWRRLHAAHALVLDPAGEEIRMANPFSGVPTAYAVRAAGRSWWANCAWDAFGICAALGVDGEIDTACPDCGDPIHVEVAGRRPDDATLLFHVLVPAVRWWEDIAFT